MPRSCRRFDDLSVYSVQSVYDDSQLRNIVVGARSARCRQRFATPVILYEGKVRANVTHCTV